MDYNKRREAPSIAYWRIRRSWNALPHIFKYPNQPREALMRDLGLKPREYGISPIGSRPKEG
jgi:hypothetical protein